MNTEQRVVALDTIKSIERKLENMQRENNLSAELMSRIQLAERENAELRSLVVNELGFLRKLIFSAKTVTALAPDDLSIPVALMMAADIYKVPASIICGESRTARITEPRQLAMYLAVEMGFDASRVATYFEKDRGTVQHAVKAVKDRLETQAKLRLAVSAVLDRIQEVR